MNPVGMTILILAGLGVFAWTALRRWKLMNVAAAPADRCDNVGERVAGVVRYVFGQSRMFRYSGAGFAHALIFGGFVVLMLRALILFARGYSSNPGFGFWIFHEGALLGNVYTFLKDIIGVLIIVGVIYFLYQRLIAKPKRIELSAEAVFILFMILGVVLSDMLYEAAGFVRTSGENLTFHGFAPAASVVSFALSGLPESGVSGVYHVCFWLHSIIILTFLNFLPHGKHFHVLTVLPNVYFRDLNGIGRLKGIEDIEGRIEREQTLGVRTVADLSWKAVLDLYTCTECGRCSDHCPAAITGKALSPKHLSMDLRNYMYEHDAKLRGGGEADELVGEWIKPEVLWACTTCGACEQECPVLISYVDKIVDMRRHLTMEKGEFPEQLQNAFRGLETVGNPYSIANEQRADWAKGLDIPLLSEKPDAEILFWVGCSPSFDDRARKIAVATAKLMKHAGVDFAILGPEEQCTGDPARRAGNEYLFQTFARGNVETLNNHNVKRIVTICPHCFNTLKNEYPDFGGNYDVIHHTVFLLQLVREGKLEPTQPVPGRIAYHDSCYLGRYNDVYDAPREILKSIPGVQLAEPAETRDRGMCCGAGGAQMWKEEEKGDAKVNHERTRQLLRVLPDAGQPRTVATACPFCKTMLTDGLTDLEHEDVVQQDVAEILWRSVSAR